MSKLWRVLREVFFDFYLPVLQGMALAVASFLWFLFCEHYKIGVFWMLSPFVLALLIVPIIVTWRMKP